MEASTKIEVRPQDVQVGGGDPPTIPPKKQFFDSLEVLVYCYIYFSLKSSIYRSIVYIIHVYVLTFSSGLFNLNQVHKPHPYPSPPHLTDNRIYPVEPELVIAFILIYQKTSNRLFIRLFVMWSLDS